MTHRVPGERIGEFWDMEYVPEDYFEVTRIGESLVRAAEDVITELVPSVRRRVTRTSLEYRTPGDVPFMRVKPMDRFLRVLMPGDRLSFVDDYGLVQELPVAEFGGRNVEYRMRDTDAMHVLRDYTVLSLSMVDYFRPGDLESERDEFVIRLTGGTYEGPMVDGKPSGKGRFTWPDGSVYEGSVVNGHVTGRGRYTRANGDVFEAYFTDGRISKDVPGEKGAGRNGSGQFTFGYIF